MGLQRPREISHGIVITYRRSNDAPKRTTIAEDGVRSPRNPIQYIGGDDMKHSSETTPTKPLPTPYTAPRYVGGNKRGIAGTQAHSLHYRKTKISLAPVKFAEGAR